MVKVFPKRRACPLNWRGGGTIFSLFHVYEFIENMDAFLEHTSKCALLTKVMCEVLRPAQKQKE
jgi:hypothetical protein